LLMATAGASPWIESFTLAGELLAWVPVALSLLAFVAYLRSGRGRWLLVAGLLTGSAVMIKQSAFDGGLAAVAYLLWLRGRGGVRPALALAGSALVPVASFAAFAPSFHAWWYAVVIYRGQGDSLFTGSLGHRYHLFTLSLPALLKGLGVLGALALVGWRRSPVLVRFWLGAAALGVLGGGNFHTHYYLQLVPPLCVLAGVGLVRVAEPRARAAALVFAAAGVATLTVTAPLWFASSTAQAKAIWPRDPHLVHDRALARYIRAHTEPHQRVLVLWAAADLYYLADRDPALRYMWYRNIESIPHALPLTRTVLERQWASLVVAVQPPRKIDKTGTVARILFEDYRLIARVDGIPVYRPDQLDDQAEALRHEQHAVLPSPPPRLPGRGDLLRL